VVSQRTTRGNTIRLLSRGLSTAGGAVASTDGKRIVFAGKIQPKDEWQIYEASPDGVSLKRLTSRPGGCMDPALLPDGTLLFVSPVPKLQTTRRPSAVPRLYAQRSTGPAQQLTFGNIQVSNPSVLSDGLILFVGVLPPVGSNAPPRFTLYTINSDGTEISAFAGQHDNPSTIQRPRELEDGRIVFLRSNSPTNPLGIAEFVLSAAPFRGRKPLFTQPTQVRAVEAAGNGELLICSALSEQTGDSCPRCAVFKSTLESATLGTPVLDQLEWDQIEAVPTVAIRKPMGRLSNVDPSRNTGQILCLNASRASYGSSRHSHGYRAARMRVFTESSQGDRVDLGEVQLQADGSFMAEVPADVPLGFEALDEQGTVIRRDPPLMWVRPGENRACIGCHEPHNSAPRNIRPLAVRAPVPRLLGAKTLVLAQDHH
jgi:hypothetical protein